MTVLYNIQTMLEQAREDAASRRVGREALIQEALSTVAFLRAETSSSHGNYCDNLTAILEYLKEDE